MSKRNRVASVLLAALPALVSCNCNAAEDNDWSLYGRTYDDHRFSPLNEINETTVSNLGLAWSTELGTTRGLEATPLVENGVIYTTGAWSVVFAIDARTGKILWTYDPKTARDRANFICCDVVNRGVALYKGKVYFGTLDGRLIALDEHTGAPVWTVDASPARPYAITSAPRIAKGMVVIGNAGSEYGVRGYITAYDAETGKMAWRFYTVPGNRANGFESKALEAAAKTWRGDWWITGAGGTVWEGIVYDPALDLLYFGTGNPTAWYRALRGGGGDNLYTASILAAHAATGELAWYFQTTPGDNWDFDATQPLMQADLTIGGRARKVIMQANKNGFFYVLDRETGEFISGSPFVSGITWASGLDPKTGRPIETPAAYTKLDAFIISPSPDGAHNWHPMSFNPATGFVYFGVKQATQSLHTPDAKWKYDPERGNVGGGDYDGPLKTKFKSLPHPTGELVAWDPAAGKAAWRVAHPVVEAGGTLATAGNLVFQGRSDGIFAAYRATDGTQLWSFDTGTGIMAAPVTYRVDGVQYVSILSGWGGPVGLGNDPIFGPTKPGFGRITTYRLGATGVLKAPPFGHKDPPVPAITEKQPPKAVLDGSKLFDRNCSGCHGNDAIAGPLPDLRYSSKETLGGLEAIVLGGSRASDGMPSFSKILKPDEVRAIRSYIISRAQESAKK